MSYRDQAMELLVQNAVPERPARHGTLWRFKNGKTVLIGHGHGSRRDNNEFAWRGVLANVKRAMRADEEEERPMAEVKPHPVIAPNFPGNGAGGGQKLGLAVTTKSKKVVLEELTSQLELAPYQVKALLEREGLKTIPDDIKLSVNAQGYLRVTWSSTRESVEE